MPSSRDPQARPSAATDDARILSVSAATTYIHDHWHGGEPGLISERTVRRHLATGTWPCTRTPAGRLGITVADLERIWTPSPADPGEYREWRAYAPTSRRLDVVVLDAEHVHIAPLAAGRRLTLVGDSDGDNYAFIVVRDRAQLDHLNSSPLARVFYEPRGKGRPRLGTWLAYAEAVALVHVLIVRAGWTLTGEELRLLAALRQYGETKGGRP